MAARHRIEILVAAALFSTGGAAIKLTQLGPWQVAGSRSGIAALVLLLALPRARRFWTPRTLLVGAAFATTMILYVTGNKLTTAANTIFLQATAPLYLLWLGPWVLRERLRRADLVLTAVIAAGLAMFFVGRDPVSATAPDPVTGNVVGALCGLSWALTLLGLRWLGRDAPDTGRDEAGAAVVAGNILAFLVCLPFALPVGPVGGLDVTAVVYLGVFQIGAAYVAMTRGVRGVPALEASLLLLLEPVLNGIWAWLLHGERPGPWAAAGCATILVAMVARSLAGSPEDPEPPAI